LFNGGKADTHKEAPYVRQSLITEGMKYRADAHFRENREFIIDEFHEVTYFAICLLRDLNSSPPIQKTLCQMVFKNDHRRTQGGEAKGTVTGRLNGLMADFYDEGIVKLMLRLNRLRRI
jgi:hypothetical protein